MLFPYFIIGRKLKLYLLSCSLSPDSFLVGCNWPMNMICFLCVQTHHRCAPNAWHQRATCHFRLAICTFIILFSVVTLSQGQRTMGSDPMRSLDSVWVWRKWESHSEMLKSVGKENFISRSNLGTNEGKRATHSVSYSCQKSATADN